MTKSNWDRALEQQRERDREKTESGIYGFDYDNELDLEDISQCQRCNSKGFPKEKDGTGRCSSCSGRENGEYYAVELRENGKWYPVDSPSYMGKA